MFQHALSVWGDKMSKTEIEDVFSEFDIDEDYMVATREVLGLFVAQKEEKKEVRIIEQLKRTILAQVLVP